MSILDNITKKIKLCQEIYLNNYTAKTKNINKPPNYKKQVLPKVIKIKRPIKSKEVNIISFLLDLIIILVIVFPTFSSQQITITTIDMNANTLYKIVNNNSFTSIILDSVNLGSCGAHNNNLYVICLDNYIFIKSDSKKAYRFKLVLKNEITHIEGLFKNSDVIETIDFSGFKLDKFENLSHLFDSCTSLTSIKGFAPDNAKDLSYLFHNCISLKDIEYNSTFKGYKKATNMKNMFYNCRQLKAINLSTFDTSKVTNMEKMFSNCQLVTQLDVSKFDVSSVRTMRSMFEFCARLTSLILYDFITIEVTDMSFMFYQCTNLKSIDVSSFKIKKVSDMSFMFYECKSLTSIVLFTTLSSTAINMHSMFQGCSSLKILNLFKSKTLTVNNMNKMFYNCHSLTSVNLTKFQTNNVVEMKSMFYGCSSLISLHITNFQVNLLEDLEYMFAKCSSLTSLDLSKFYTPKVRNMKYMFYECSSLRTLNIENLDTSKVVNMEYFLSGCSELSNIDLNNFITNNVLNMDHMFSGCSKLTELNVTKFNTSKVTNMVNMFSGCSSLTYLDLSVFDTRNVINMESLFKDCSSLTSILISDEIFKTNNVKSMNSIFSGCSKISSFNISLDTSSVTDMGYLFNGCSSLIDLNLDSFNCQNVVNMMNMFSHCSSLTSLDLSNINTQIVKNTNSMFSGCIRLTYLNLGNFKTDSTENMNSMFKGCLSLKELNLNNFVTKNVADMGYLFYDCMSLSELDLNNFVLPNIKSMEYMFSGCLVLNSIKLPNFNSPSVINLSHMFSDCSSLISLNLTNFYTNKVTNMEYMFSGCTQLEYLNLDNFNTELVTTMEHMFSGCYSLTFLNLSSFITSKVERMNGMFYGCSSLKVLDISNFNTKSVKNMAFMFYKLKSIESLDLAKFNTRNVEFMYYMFEECESLTSLNLTNFNTIKIKSMDKLFSGCSSLKFLNILNFNTSSVTSMNYLFSECNSLISLDLSKMDTSLTTSMNHMFSGCSSLKNIKLNSFNTSLITSMEYLFYKCSSLESLDLSSFDTSLVTDMGHMFYKCSQLPILNLLSFRTPLVKNMEYMFSNCYNLEILYISSFNTSLVENYSHMFYGCTNLLSLDLEGFILDQAKDMQYMFYNCENLGFINFEQANDTNIEQYYNMFTGTPENMVFCFNESNTKFMKQIENKQCTYVDCDNDWEKIREKVVATSNECVDQCKRLTRFFYRYRCYERCPKGTYPHNFICNKEIYEYKKNQTCDIKNYFLHNCNITLNTDLEKHKFILNTTEGIMNADLYDIILYVLDYNKIYTIKEKNEVYQLYSLSNKIRDPELTYIDLDECGKLLKNKYKLKENEEILVFKVQYTSPDFKIPIVEYSLYGRDGSIKLNLNICNKLKIMEYIPKIINDYKDYEYNPNNNYYYDDCSPIEYESKTDLTIYDRRNEFNINNMSLCESHCTYKGIVHQEIICECDIKIKFNSYMNNIEHYNLIYRFSDLGISHFNLWLMKCFYSLFQKGALTNNMGHYIILSIMFLIILGTILFYSIERNIMLKDIKALLQDTLDKNKRKELYRRQKKLLKNELIDEEIFPEQENPNSIYNYKRKGNNITKIPNQDLKCSKAKEVFDENSHQIANNLELSIDKLEIKENSIERTDNEMNNLSYESAIQLDKRTFCQYYLSLIRTKQLIVFCVMKNDFNSRIIKICYALIIYSLFLAMNALFIEDSSLHRLHILEGSIEYKYHFIKVLYPTLICFIISKFLETLIFTETDILRIRKNDGKETEEKMGKVCFRVGVKCILFFSISLLYLFLIWIYISSFCYVFKRNQIFLIITSSISFGIFLAVPMLLNVIPSIFRILSLKTDNSSVKKFCVYRFSQFLQMVL